MNWSLKGIEPFITQGSKVFIRNLNTQLSLLSMGEVALPLTLNHWEYENSYVCSPYTAFVSYTKEELRKLKSPLLIYPLQALISLLSFALKACEINRVVHVNNWMLSTNLYDDIPLNEVPKITQQLVGQYPNHLIIFRSLTEYTNAALKEKLVQSGYILIPSRQVYFFDRKKIDFLKRHNTQIDLKLLAKTPYRLQRHEDISELDYERITELYNLLYIDKYSHHNPQFTCKLIRLWHEEKLMTFYGFRDSEGILQGVVGYFIQNRVMTTPLVGYNTTISQAHGLYRMLIALVLRDAAEKEIVLNLSSGASGFKVLRGAFPEIESSAVYAKHLSLKRRILIRSLQFILERIGVPLMKKYRL